MISGDPYRVLERPTVTTTYPEPAVLPTQNVYRPQEDSRLLVDVMHETGLIQDGAFWTCAPAAVSSR